MLKAIKSVVPMPMKQALYPIKDKTYDQWQKKRLFKRMQVKHAELIEQIKGKQKIKVVFLAMHESVWKVDPVFKKMLADSFFEPEILVCPYTVYGEERMLKDMEQAYNYFSNKNYPVQKSIKDDGSWITLDELKPDIVFFTNPHNLTRKEYYEDAYLNYLSCYVPYHHEVVTNAEQFNQRFHVAQWKIFASNYSSQMLYEEISISRGRNVILTGFPAMEPLREQSNLRKYSDSWKSQDNRIKVIWAPHHSIEGNDDTPYANFLVQAQLFKELSKKYSDVIVWSFKPHPLLKQKLYLHPEWGQDKTEQYYSYWQSQEYSQLDEGDYTDLFASSDALIHDSGSFLAEYLYLKKPVLFNISEINKGQYLSSFGKEALSACSISYSERDIIDFLEKIQNDMSVKKEHLYFLEQNIDPFFQKKFPSDLIIESIIKHLNQ